MNKERSKGIVAIFVLVIFLFIVFLILGSYTVASLRGGSKNSSTASFDGKGKIAVVEVEGVIMNSKNTIKKLLIAEKNEDYKAIILRVDSPGGAVGPTQEIYEEIRRIDKDKPIYASFGTVAASGGYYIGAATRRIYANPGALTGSIGVIMNFMDLSGLYEFAKVSPQLIKAGKYKDIGSTARQMTQEERALLEEMALNVHEQFINHVFDVRSDRIVGGLDGLKKYAQGQIFSGEGAHKRGLVDEMAGLHEAGRRIYKELKLKGDFGLSYIKLEKEFSLTSLLGGIEESVKDISYSVRNNNIPLLIYKP